jgi:2-polyprenyl-6-hydroxyphenyl methylase/3-demethylubiquinone-9 3-methyltransferase
VEALQLYAGQGLGVRLHTRIRAFTCPMQEVVARAPADGRLLEVGCGHGLFANECALRNARLDVLGIDPAPAKVLAASGSVGARGNVRFREGRIETLGEDGFDCVAVIDVLYLVPRGEWGGFLEACRGALRAGGRLLLKEIDVRPRWKFYRLVLQETLSVRLLGITQGGGFAFAGPDEMSGRLRAAGFRDVSVTDLARGYLTPHVLYEAVRA